MAGGKTNNNGVIKTATTRTPDQGNSIGGHADPQNKERNKVSKMGDAGNTKERVIWSINGENNEEMQDPENEGGNEGDQPEDPAPALPSKPGRDTNESGHSENKISDDNESNEEEDTDGLPAPDNENHDDGNSQNDDHLEGRMTYYVPFRQDLLRNKWNRTGSGYQWIRKIFAIIKHRDKTAALRGEFLADGKRRRFRELSDIPQGGDNGFRVKSKQHRTSIRTLFGEIESSLKATEIKDLPGIQKINTPTRVFRIDKYDGEFTTSVGWIANKHPYYTHTESYGRELIQKSKETQIDSQMIEEYKNQLPQYDPRRRMANSEVPFPHFHLTTEERKISSNGKRFSTKILAVHTSKSAAHMVRHVLADMANRNIIKFIPSSFRHDGGVENKLKFYANTKKT